MKNVLLVWNIVLTALLGYLLYQQCGGKKTGGAASTANLAKKDSLAAFRIAYFDYDSLDNGYEKIKDIKERLTRQEESNAAEFQRLDQRYVNRLKQLQEKAQKEGMSQQQQEAAGMELEKLRQDNEKLKADISEKYGELTMNLRREVQQAIENFLKEYNTGKKYSYIISYEPGLFYYRDSSMNITADVVEGLNRKYREEKTPAKKETSKEKK